MVDFIRTKTGVYSSLLILSSLSLAIAIYITHIMIKSRSIKKLLYYVFCDLTLIGTHFFTLSLSNTALTVLITVGIAI